MRSVGYLTNETVFNLTSLPSRLAVIGGGPIGCELGQAFQRLGSKVVLLHNKDHLLDKEDADAAHLVERALTDDGMHLTFNSQVRRVEELAEGKAIFFQENHLEQSFVADEILVAAGRTPNVSDRIWRR